MSVFGNQKKILSILSLSLVTALFVYLTHIFYWTADSCYFSLRFNFDDSNPTVPVESIQDLIMSSSAYYMIQGGRFFCSSVVVAICAFVGRTGFEVCNALAWILYILISAKLIGIRQRDTLKMFILVIVSYLIFLTLPLDPPFLINYLWMGLVVLVWLYLFFNVKPDKWWKGVVLFLFGLIAGNSQEAFTIPLGGALFVYVIIELKKKDSQIEWWSLTGFVIGLILLVIAPGNFKRLASSEGVAFIYEIMHAMASLGCLALILLLWAFTKGKSSVAPFGSKLNSLLILSVIFSLVFILILKANSLARTLIPINMFLLMLVLRRKEFRFKTAIVVILGVIAVWCSIREYEMFKFNRIKYSEIEKKYHMSETGKISIPDSLFFHNDGNNCYYNLGWEIRERSVSPGKPSLKIYPEKLNRVYIGQDTNMFIKAGPQKWIVAQSVNRPKPVMVKRTLTLGDFEYQIPIRELYVRDFKDNIIDTVNNTIISVYINYKPYMKSELSW